MSENIINLEIEIMQLQNELEFTRNILHKIQGDNFQSAAVTKIFCAERDEARALARRLYKRLQEIELSRFRWREACEEWEKLYGLAIYERDEARKELEQLKAKYDRPTDAV